MRNVYDKITIVIVYDFLFKRVTLTCCENRIIIFLKLCGYALGIKIKR